MKFASKSDRGRWKRLSFERGRRREYRSQLKKMRARQREFSRFITVSAPKRFLLERGDSHSNLTSSLEALRTRLRKGDGKVLIDFSRTVMIYPGGGLLFYAELLRLQGLFPGATFRCRKSRSDRVNQVLQYLGVFKIFNYRSNVVPRRSDVVSWRHASADAIDCTGAGQMIEAYSSLSQPITKLLFKAASEAISNAVTHAYDAPRDDGLPTPNGKRWWMFCREFENKFYMSVCDLGVGIPRTLTVKNPDEIVRKIINNISGGRLPNDAQLILGAMEYARTRTNRPNQGKGLLDLRRIIERIGKGKLHVFSNKGCVTFDAEVGYRSFNYERSIKGTLIVWSVPLSLELDSNED